MSVEDAIIEGVDLTGQKVSEALSAIPGISALVRIGQIAGILVIVYIAFLIVQAVLQLRYALRMKRLVRNVEEINHKLDKLIAVKPQKKKNRK